MTFSFVFDKTCRAMLSVFWHFPLFLAKQSTNFIILAWLCFWQHLLSNVVCVLTFCFVFDKTCWAMLSSPEWGDLFVYSEFVWNVIICKWSYLFLTKVGNQCRSYVQEWCEAMIKRFFCDPVSNVNRLLSWFSCHMVMFPMIWANMEFVKKIPQLQFFTQKNYPKKCDIC